MKRFNRTLPRPTSRRLGRTLAIRRSVHLTPKRVNKEGKRTAERISAELALKSISTQNLSEYELIAALTRKSFYDFVKEFWHVVVPEKPRWNWHIRYLCDQMQQLAERVFRGEAKEHDLVINISPGTSKSSICSIFFLPWLWSRMPTARVIGCSYAERLALTLSRKCRDVIKSELYQNCFPEIKLRADQDTKGFFANTKGGERYAVGSNGSVIGMHAHFILIDDPIDPDKVLSEVEIESVNNWIEDTLSGRKVDKSITVTVLIMQRLHQNDPTAQMLKNKKVKHIKLPACTDFEIKPESLKRYYIDGLMDPHRLGWDVLHEIKSKPRGDYVFAGQYGQDPVPPGGGMFKTKRIMMERDPPQMVKLVRYWDKAGTLGGGAYTVGIKMGLDKYGNIWVLDVIREQLDSFRREKLIRQTARLDGRACLIGLEQEPGSGGLESVENTVRRLRGWSVKVLKPVGDKELRADPFSVQVNAGHVRMLENPAWNGEYIEEMRFFPYSTFKDQIDASAGAFTLLSRAKVRVGGMRKGYNEGPTVRRLGQKIRKSSLSNPMGLMVS